MWCIHVDRWTYGCTDILLLGDLVWRICHVILNSGSFYAPCSVWWNTVCDVVATLLPMLHNGVWCMVDFFGWSLHSSPCLGTSRVGLVYILCADAATFFLALHEFNWCMSHTWWLNAFNPVREELVCACACASGSIFELWLISCLCHDKKNHFVWLLLFFGQQQVKKCFTKFSSMSLLSALFK